MPSAGGRPGGVHPCLRLAAALLALGLATPAGAISLADFVTEVVDSSPLVREQVHAYRRVARDHDIALAGWRPSLDLTASVGAVSRDAANTGRRRRDYDTAEAGVSLTQNLFDGFDTTNQISQARARISSEAYRLVDVADNVALEAVRAYLNALSEKRLVELAAQNVESHENILANLRELSARGITRRSDVEQTEGRLARAQASLIAQQNNLEDALTEIHRLLGRYLSTSDLEEPGTPPGPADTVEDLIETALEVHPALASAQENIEAARFDYRRSRSADLPSLDLRVQQNVGVDNDGPSGRSEEGSVTLNLRYNLYRGGADQAEQRKRLSVMHENQAFLDRVRRQVVDTLRLAWAADRALHEQLPFLERHADKSLQTVQLYREEYLLQKRDLIDLLDAESELNQALSREAEARYGALTARYRIYEGVGALLDALGLGAALSDEDLVISRVRAAGIDAETLDADRDRDGRLDARDQCDNSAASRDVDGFGCSDQRELALGYAAAAQPFQAMPDRFVMAKGETLVLPARALIANDRTQDRDRPLIRFFTQPGHGAVTQNVAGDLVYTPDPAFVGEDTFSYTLEDRRARSARGEVTISVEVPAAAVVPDTMTVRFGYKQLTLTPESQARMDPVIEALRRDPRLRVEVRTYTDNVGPARYNQRLSDARADALREMLITRGIAADRIDAAGEGENDPVADNASEEGRALNRRGELRFLPSGGG